MKKLLTILITILILTGCSVSFNNSFTGNNSLKIIASDTYETMNLEEFISDGTSVEVHIDYMPDIDIVSTLNSNPKAYDAILISNSMWTYMLNNVYLTESKSLAISPVVFAIKESKAKELDLIGKDITNKDIIDLIKDGKITYTMPSAVRTNVGATSYLGFINVLSGNPQVLSSSHLSSALLKSDLATLFKNVERNSGSELYTFDILKQNDYDALVATEAAIINYNLENPKDALYMLYPSDGVPITDSMFTFIGNADKKDTFIKIRDYLLSDAGKEIFNDNNFRTWYGGTSENPGSNFKKEWGIDTSKVLKITSFPSKEVMNEAFSLYIDSFRKPAAVTFVLDYSGSMEGKGIEQLDEAVSYIFNNESSATEYLQFSDSDLVNIIYFFYGDLYQIQTVKGSEVSSTLNELKSLYAAGGTPLYEATLSAISTEKDLMDQYGDTYNYSVILMTDGEPTGINFSEFEYYWKNYDFDKVNIPTYTIAFGNAIVSELERLAELTGGKAFDGRLDLMGAFKEIRGYN